MEEQKTILLIDDEVDLTKMLSLLLEEKGYRVEIAHNGLQGLKKVKEVKPDLIILDLIMPDMNGIEFFERMCENSNRPKFPVLIYTARSNLQDIFDTFNVDSFIAKPASTELLFEEIRKVILSRQKIDAIERLHQLNSLKKILIVDDNPTRCERISATLSEAGYTLQMARDSQEAMESIEKSRPDLALINLKLGDSPGDILVLKAQQMMDIIDVNFLLYYEQDNDPAQQVLKKLGDKTGVTDVIRFDRPHDFLEKVNLALS